MHPVDSPATLMARVAEGDARAFTLLVAELYGPSLRVATRVAGDRAEAEDALQGALARLWTEAARFDPTKGSVGGWFRRIVVNQCLDRRRRLKVVAPIEAAATVPSDLPDPFEASAANARARRVDAAMAQLNPRQRAAITLFHGEGASMAEVAAALDTTPKAVEGLLARARSELSRLLASDRPETRPMTEPFFHLRAAEIIAAYGADPARWPDGERATALAVIAASAELHDCRTAAAVLDADLARWAHAPVAAGDAARAAAAALRQPRPYLRWAGVTGIAAAFVAGLLLVAPAHRLTPATTAIVVATAAPAAIDDGTAFAQVFTPTPDEEQAL